MEKTNKIATLPVPKLMLGMETPMILSMMLQAVYNIVDSAFVSNVQITVGSGITVNLDGISGAMINGGTSGTVIYNYNNDNSRTVNQTNNSPKSLSRLEIYRQTRNALNV